MFHNGQRHWKLLMKYYIQYFRHKPKHPGTWSYYKFWTLFFHLIPISYGTSQHLDSHQPDHEPGHHDSVNSFCLKNNLPFPSVTQFLRPAPHELRTQSSNWLVHVLLTNLLLRGAHVTPMASPLPSRKVDSLSHGSRFGALKTLF